MIYAAEGRVVIQAGTVTLDQVEKVVLAETLVATKDKKAAAKALGISRSALYAKLKRHGLWDAPCAVCGGEGHKADAHGTQLPAETAPSRPYPPSPLPSDGATPAPPGAAPNEE